MTKEIQTQGDSKARTTQGQVKRHQGLTHKDLGLSEEAGLDGVDVTDDPFVDLEQIFEGDLTRRPIDQRLVDVLQGRVQPEDLVVLDDALAADGQLRFQDGSLKKKQSD